MVISLFLSTCSHYCFSPFTIVEHGDTRVGGKLHAAQQGLFHKECFLTLKSLVELELLAGN